MKAKAERELQPDSVLTELTKSVLAAGLAQNEGSAVGYIIDHYRQHELGVVVTQAHLDRLLAQGEDQAINYSRDLVRDYGDTPTAACALDFLLEHLQRQSTEAYLSACTQAIQGTATRQKCVALLSRIDFYCDGNKHKLAALDTLRFWHLYPEKVDSMLLKPFLCGNLERAGWLLEGDIMSGSPDPASDAGSLLNYMESIGIDRVLQAGQIESPVQGLYLWAPDTTAILEKSDSATLTKFELANVLLHCSRLELDKAKESRALPLLSQYFDLVDSLLLEKDAHLLQLRLLNEGAARALSKYVQINEGARTIALNALGAKQIRDMRGALERLADAQVRLCGDALAAAKPGRHGIDQLLQFLDDIDAPRVSATMLESFVAANPGWPFLRSLRMKLAELQRDKFGQPEKAAETFLSIYHDAPESVEGTRAALLGCILLVQQEHHEAALTHLQELEAVMAKEDDDYSLVLYLAAVCEHFLGFKDEAEEHINRLLIGYPGSNVCAKALLWLGSAKLAEQQYEEAQSRLKDLVERYPRTPEAERANEYLERLTKLPQGTP